MFVPPLVGEHAPRELIAGSGRFAYRATPTDTSSNVTKDPIVRYFLAVSDGDKGTVIRRLGQDFLYNLAGDVGQAEIATGVTVGQSFVIQTQQVQDRGVEVVNVYLIRRHGASVVVAVAVAEAPLNPAPCHPGSEGFGMMFTPFGVLAGIERRPSELGRPDDQRVIQHAA